jgi:hypothetical protein
MKKQFTITPPSNQWTHEYIDNATVDNFAHLKQLRARHNHHRETVQK